MDARQRRTRERLDAAILTLAATIPVDRIAVADIARSADISRDTFYRWSASAEELLADSLGRRLDDAIAERAAASGPGGATTIDPLTETILTFVSSHAAIYRLASRPRMNATLRDGLVSRIEGILADWIDAHPGILPTAGGREATPFARDVYVAYAANGAVGVYEVWLAQGDTDDIGGVEALIYDAAASWWRGGARPR